MGEWISMRSFFWHISGFCYRGFECLSLESGTYTANERFWIEQISWLGAILYDGLLNPD